MSDSCSINGTDVDVLVWSLSVVSIYAASGFSVDDVRTFGCLSGAHKMIIRHDAAIRMKDVQSLQWKA